MAAPQQFFSVMRGIANTVRSRHGLDNSIPYSVTSMISAILDLGRTDNTDGVSAFMERSLDEIEIPACVTSIGAYAFAGCGNLSSVSKAKNLRYDVHAFDDCDDGAIPTSYNPDIAGTYNKGTVAPERVPNGNEHGVIIDPSVENAIRTANYNTINKQMSGLANATRALLPGVTSKLSVQDIFTWLYNDIVSGGTNNILARLIDRSVTDLTLSDGMYNGNISRYALHDCTQLSRLYLSKSGFIEENAMVNCGPNLHISCQDYTMVFDGAFDAIDAVDSSGAWFTYIGGPAAESCVYTTVHTTGYNVDGYNETSTVSHTIDAGTDHMIRYGCNQDGYAADQQYSTEGTDGYGIHKLDFMNTSFIAKKAFANITVRDNADIRSLDLSGVRFVDEEAFAGNSNLTELKLPNTAIDVNAFAFGHIGITSVSINTNVNLIGKGVFNNCSNLESVRYNVAAQSAPEATFSGCSNLKEITFGGQPTIIGASMFADCTSVGNVAIPNTVSRLEEGAFYNCGALREINLPTNLAYIGPYTFGYCSNLSGTMDFRNTNLVAIYEEAFRGTEVSKFILPATVTHIDSDAFVGTTIGTVISCYFPKSVISDAEGWKIRFDTENIFFMNV